MRIRKKDFFLKTIFRFTYKIQLKKWYGWVTIYISQSKTNRDSVFNELKKYY